MADIIAVCFDDKETAENALQKLVSMQKEHLVELSDAVIVTKDENGKVKLRQSVNMTAAGAASGGLWGTLIGLLFLNPLIGLAAGAATGAIAGAFTDYGINDDFMKSMGDRLTDGSSALFFLTRKTTIDKVMPELGELGGEVFHTSLSNEDEAKLREALEGEARRRVEAGEPLVDPAIETEHRHAHAA